MFGIGIWELVVIAVVALLFIGPEQLPRFFRALGRATREFQRASRELREQLTIEGFDGPVTPTPPRRPAPPAIDVPAAPPPAGALDDKTAEAKPEDWTAGHREILARRAQESPGQAETVAEAAAAGAAPQGGSDGAAPQGGSDGAAPQGGSDGAMPRAGSDGAMPQGGSDGRE
jgi:TatA/E family protein of Tat protein translocase